MYVTVNCNQALNIGDIVSYNINSNCWELATSITEEISVVKTSPQNDGTEENPEYVCKIIISGVAHCYASRAIPIQGGQLNVENGKVYVDNSLTESPAFIVPKDINESDRIENSLIRIILR